MNTDAIFKKNNTTITVCPQCSLQAMTETGHHPSTLCPYCGYSCQINGTGIIARHGTGITVIQSNGKATFHSPSTENSQLKSILELYENEHPHLFYKTHWDEQNKRPILIAGTIETFIRPDLWQPLPSIQQRQANGKKVLKITIYRGHDDHSAYMYEGLIYAHKIDTQWDIYIEDEIKSTHIPYYLTPIRTIQAGHPDWQRMMKVYNKQENLDFQEDQ